jgi:hypothetical protein
MPDPDALWQVPFTLSSARRSPSGDDDAKPTIITLHDNIVQFPKLQEDNNNAHITYTDDGGALVDLSEGKAAGAEDDEFSANLAEHMNDLDMGRLAEDIMEGIDADLQSREQWIENRDRAIDLLGLKIEPPRTGPGGGGAPLRGMSTAKDPALLEAVIRGQANAIGEFLPAEGPAKIADVGDVENDELGTLLEKDFNYYLVSVATEYYPDTKQMYAWMYFGGSGFKKVYSCALRKRPVSESVDAKDLVVSNAATDLLNANRVTHIIELRKSEFRRMIVAGMYLDVADPAPTAPDRNRLDQKLESIEGVRSDNMRPEDQPYTVYECRCEAEIEWDRFVPKKFKNKGVPLPYCVSIEKDSRRILSIYRDWKQDDEEARRKRTFVKFSYIDWMGFYGIGLLHVMGNLAMALTAMLRIAIDNGMFSNFPGGLTLKQTGSKQASNELVAGPGQFPAIDGQGLDDIRKVVMAMPYQDIKQGFLALMTATREVTQRLGSTGDTMVGEGRADIPVGTILALIEQASKVESAVHKGMHSSTAEEFELLIELFRQDPEALYRHQRKKKAKGGISTWNEEKVLQALNDYDLVPRSDPNTPSQIHRVMKAVALLQMAQGAPPGTFNTREVYQNAINILGYKDTAKFMAPPPDPNALPAPPNSQEIMARAKLIDSQAKQSKVQADAQKSDKELQLKAAQIGADKDVADTNLAKELVIHSHDADMDKQKLGVAQAAHGLNLRSHALDAGKAAHDAAMDVHGAATEQQGA